jgi:hypothetical protein
MCYFNVGIFLVMYKNKGKTNAGLPKVTVKGKE